MSICLAQSRAAGFLRVCLAVLIAATTLVSTMCIAELFDHECTGDDCEICLVLEVSQAALTSAATAVAAAAAAVPFALVLTASPRPAVDDACAQTPVSLKVQLVI